ncbi:MULTISPECIES: GMC oxidoreductase [unclassified Prochlorococcus]|uniref:GMC oxidoreductase n=1 Tax=unclassified Prochlorococcus TaxID=2627481 RepID=UPI000533ACCC|nr:MULTISPECIES: GMC family oxidoreductase [unclassified Prochlorococcus]KGG15123.1 Glucose-methanol-choline (GMC) oxidoreductase:NAD binding site [Prochlorococcus sp. MIT 0602]KGG17395.1 Glucose-methanol-choline (GMC) oxidoreductase:NAD binding site [Prochlorococcus sp. MIT 0603]
MINYPFEAVVIGSGATGGIAALTLAELGIRVLVIEAGPNLNPSDALGYEPLNTFKRIKGLINGENSQQAQHPGYWKSNPSLYINEKENQYSYPKNHPFIWTQGRQVGGRSLTWGGITLRLSQKDFKAASIDGYGPEWPINYLDLEKHYNYLERFFKVHGNKDNLEQLPDGEFIKNLPFTNSEKIFKEKIFKGLNYKMIHSRGFGPRKLNDNDWPTSSSVGSSLKKALSTGKVEILSNHIVEHLVMNKNQNLAEEIVIINRLNKERARIKCKLIILCASTIQTLKILLNSSENVRNNGLIDPSGKLGCYLMDHISTCRFFSLHDDNQINANGKNELSGAGSFFIPFGSKLDSSNTIDFIRGYGLWGGIDRFEPPALLKRKPKTKTGFLIGHGEVLAYEENKVTLTNKSDQFGLPIPHINCKWKENELRMVNHMNKTIEKCISCSGGEVTPFKDLVRIPFLSQISEKAFALQNSPPPPGYYIHEVGGAPMGSKEDNSVLDKWNRLWKCKNVQIVDGACWPTSAWQSPTLTMMAITRRACMQAIKNQPY